MELIMVVLIVVVPSWFYIAQFSHEEEQWYDRVDREQQAYRRR